MSERLRDLKNLGPASERQLHEVGITTPEQLAAIGSIEAYLRLKERFGSRVTRVFLRALEGALLDVHWNHLPPEIELELEEAVRSRDRSG